MDVAYECTLLRDHRRSHEWSGIPAEPARRSGACINCGEQVAERARVSVPGVELRHVESDLVGCGNGLDDRGDGPRAEIDKRRCDRRTCLLDVKGNFCARGHRQGRNALLVCGHPVDWNDDDFGCRGCEAEEREAARGDELPQRRPAGGKPCVCGTGDPAAKLCVSPDFACPRGQLIQTARYLPTLDELQSQRGKVGE